MPPTIGPSTHFSPVGQPSFASAQLSTHCLTAAVLPRAGVIVAQVGLMVPLLGLSLQSASMSQVAVQ
jgi:hypothetical protein